MKTNYLKISMLLLAGIALTTTVKAQNTVKADSGYHLHNSYDEIYSKSGSGVEHIQTNWHDKIYTMKLVNNKLTELAIDGEKIPSANWNAYSKVIGEIREQMKKDRKQASLDRAQANLDQVQAGKDRKEAERDRAQANLDRIQAEKEQQEAKIDQQQALKDQAEAKIDQEQAIKDQAQAKLDQEQAVKDQEQAKLDQKQAEEDQRLMKELLSDLVKDGIASDEKSVVSVVINSNEMMVNDKKMPDEVFARYKAKYSRFAGGNFTYGNDDQGFHGIHIGRPE
jgi:colicin import membrane protein